MKGRVGIVGAGLAGLTAAISLAERGFDVTVLYNGKLGNSNSDKIQAGIALPILDGDSVSLHVIDTLKTGLFMNDIDVVWNIISKATEAYDFLHRLGVSFESVELEGGHSRPRVFSIRGETGKHIMKVMRERARELGIELVNKEIHEVLIKNNECLGVISSDGNKYLFDSTIIASGGYTGIYRYTAGFRGNLGVLIGDYIRKGGIAMDLEFVQFHPTAYVSPDGDVILISEAVRGRGAIITDSKGNRFVNELAPRDVVSRAIYRKLLEGEKVYLDARNVKDIEKSFPSIYEALLKKGLDMKKDRIPIVPVAHYSIGGILVDLYWRTPTRRLYAIGEAAASGFHGANRLPSNSSLECIVGGLEVSRTISRDLEKLGRLKDINLEVMTFGNPSRLGNIDRLRDIMWSYVGLERDLHNLTMAEKLVNELDILPQIKTLALAIIKCAIERKESRGVHYRRDYPYVDERLKGHSLFARGECRIEGIKGHGI